LIDVRRVGTKGGSLRATVQLAEGPRPVSPSVAEFLELERSLGVDRPESFRKFAARIDAEKELVHRMLSDDVGSGAMVAGYGASATVTTLIHHFGLGERLSFIVDDNPARQGLYSPGHHIPVLPPRALLERKPDCVAILAWRFADAIMQKHQAYLQQGGRFLIPLPEARLV
jgi:hypothetical protein